MRRLNEIRFEGGLRAANPGMEAALLPQPWPAGRSVGEWAAAAWPATAARPAGTRLRRWPARGVAVLAALVAHGALLFFTARPALEQPREPRPAPRSAPVVTYLVSEPAAAPAGRSVARSTGVAPPLRHAREGAARAVSAEAPAVSQPHTELAPARPAAPDIAQAIPAPPASAPLKLTLSPGALAAIRAPAASAGAPALEGTRPGTASGTRTERALSDGAVQVREGNRCYELAESRASQLGLTQQPSRDVRTCR